MYTSDRLKRTSESEQRSLKSHLDVAIIGAGHSGLSLSALLVEAGVSHQVLEAETIGSSWTRRWDSFRLNTPNFLTALPGYQYDGMDPTGFATAPDVIEMLTGYARRRQLPVVEGCVVHRVFAAGDGYRVITSEGTLEARCVVVASGNTVARAGHGRSSPLPPSWRSSTPATTVDPSSSAPVQCL